MKLQYLDILDPKDIESAFRAASKGRADAFLVLQTPILNSQRRQIADLRAKEPTSSDVSCEPSMWKTVG